MATGRRERTPLPRDPGGSDQPEPSVLASAQAALDDGRWGDVHELLDGSPVGDDPAGMELRALALYAQGRFEASVGTWEHLHARSVATGDLAGASRAAATVALYLMMDSGLMAPVRGWLRRAEHLLQEVGESPASALVALVRTYERFMCGDVDGTTTQAALAIELGERFDVPPAVVIGRVASARARILRGEVQAGLDQLDEIGVLLMSGEVDPLTTGMMYCELVCAAQGLLLPDRVREWTVMMERWRPAHAVGGLHGRCRVHRAEMLRTTGPCDQAEVEALRACDDLRPWMRREFGWPLAELGNIRLRRGDLDGAEAAYREAHRHMWTPHPGLALVHLARGELTAARASIEDAIDHPMDIPSKERPPFGALRLAPLHEARVEIAAVDGDAPSARVSAEALTEIATTYPSRGLDATAALASARVALLDGDLEAAIAASATSAATWADLGAPFESARARLVLGTALRLAGRTDTARTEWTAAREQLERFGAELVAAEATSLLDALDASTAPADSDPTERPDPGGAPAAQSPTTPDHSPARRALVAAASGDGPLPAHVGPDAVVMFRRTGNSRIVSCPVTGTEALLRDLKGFRHIEQLVARPGRELHVLQLAAAPVANPPGTALAAPGDPTLGLVAEGGLPILDPEAIEAYRRRLAEVDEDIAEAEAMHDPARAELAQRDRDYLVAELTRAAGIGGRIRETGHPAERARTSVTRAIRYSVDRLAEHVPITAEHLAGALRTGTFCSYEPDPLRPVRWEL